MRTIVLVSVAVVAVVAVGGAIAGSYALGRSSVDLGRAKQEAHTAGAVAGSKRGVAQGYDKGYGKGFRDGVKAGRAEFKPGTYAYGRIAQRARRAGYRAGLAEGSRRGLEVGRDEGLGASFGGFDDWQVGRWYIFEVASGADVGYSSKYYMKSRVGPMEYGKTYELCDDGDGICG